MRCAFIVLLTFAFSSAAIPGAYAQVLPLVVDATQPDGDAAWWTRVDSPLAGPCVSPLLDLEPALDPRVTEPATAVSRVLQRTELSADNARALAALYPAPTLLLGRMDVIAASRVAWGGRQRAVVSLDAVWIDTQSGATILDISLQAAGFGDAPEDAVRAACAAVARSADFTLRTSVSTPATVPVADVVVRIDGPADAYVRFRTALREAVGGEVQETWATEGAVGLRVVSDMTTTRDSLLATIRALGPLPSGQILRVADEEGSVWVDLAAETGEAGGR